MGKIILLAIGVWLIITIIKRYNKSLQAPQAKPQNEDMVRCQHCGVHLPKSESLLVNQQYFCCEEHSKQHD